jgi:hypothetical protein
MLTILRVLALPRRLLGPPGAARSRGLLFILLAVLSLLTAGADAATAAANIGRWGVMGEGNPIAQHVLATYGFPALLAVKMGGIAWAALVGWTLYRVNYYRMTWILLTWAVTVNLFGTLTNISAELPVLLPALRLLW